MMEVVRLLYQSRDTRPPVLMAERAPNPGSSRVVPIRVPALRERSQDIGELVAYFLGEFSARNNFRRREIDPDVVSVLARYHWPGNVSEMRNVVERMAILNTSDRITAESIPLEIRQSPSPRSGSSRSSRSPSTRRVWRSRRRTSRPAGGGRHHLDRLLLTPTAAAILTSPTTQSARENRKPMSAVDQ